jgi:hypothetical protein
MTKYIDIKEFREQGYLQEANRTFFHPLGLALEVNILEDGTEYISGIWDYRDEPEGIYYDLKNSDQERINSFRENAIHVEIERQHKTHTRYNILGFEIEPIFIIENKEIIT